MAEEEDAAVLGVVALESMGYRVNPGHRAVRVYRIISLINEITLT